MVDPTLLAYTYEEAANVLGVTVPAVKWQVRLGNILAVGERRGVRISGKSIRVFLSRRDGLPPDIKPSGYIYLIRFMQYHKIGLSSNVKKRLQAISQGLPEPATLVHTIPTNDMVRAEELLHVEHAHCRVRGEWFNLSPSEVQKVCDIKGLWL